MGKLAKMLCVHCNKIQLLLLHETAEYSTLGSRAMLVTARMGRLDRATLSQKTDAK